MNPEEASVGRISARGNPTRLGGRGSTPRLRPATLAWANGALSLVLTALSLWLLASSYSTPVPPAWGFRGYPAILAVAYAMVGAIVASRRPENRVGWIFCAVGLIVAIQGFVSEYAVVALLARPGTLPAGLVAAWVGSWIWILYVGLITTFLLLLFPTGRLPSPRWRPVAWLSATWIALLALTFALLPGPMWNFSFAANPFGIAGAREILTLVQGLVALLSIGCGILSATAVIVRFRRSRGEERQQLKWFAYAGALLILYTPLSIASVATPVAIATQAGIPVAAGIAILKYRLYDIDIIIRRTLVYGALTAALALIYFGGVVLMEGVFRRLTGQDNDLAIIVSTLAIAALFNPLRRRIQNTVDRRFYRRKYDVEQVLSLFSASVRDEVDLDRLVVALLEVVQETMQPAHVSLWLREKES